MVWKLYDARSKDSVPCHMILINMSQESSLLVSSLQVLLAQVTLVPALGQCAGWRTKSTSGLSVQPGMPCSHPAIQRSTVALALLYSRLAAKGKPQSTGTSPSRESRHGLSDTSESSEHSAPARKGVREQELQMCLSPWAVVHLACEA